MKTDPLLAAAAAGDPAAIDTMWAGERRWVAAVVAAHAPAPDLEDILQEVALRLVQRLPELRDAEALRPWLRTIAVHACHSSTRRRAVRRRAGESLPDEPVATGVRGPVEQLADRDEVNAVLRLVSDLPIELREPLMLRAEQGMSQREIARVLEVSETTVENRLARARRLLRRAAASDNGQLLRGNR